MVGVGRIGAAAACSGKCGMSVDRVPEKAWELSGWLATSVPSQEVAGDGCSCAEGP
jgi:hypothetical protein